MKPEKRWQLQPQHPDLSARLGKVLSVSSTTGQLLLNRQLRSLNQVQAFLSQDAPTLAFPEPVMDPVIDLILSHVSAGKRILLFGDYDVDGMTSTAMLGSALTQLGASFQFHLPNRFTEGYGLSDGIVSMVQTKGIDLLITLDCGISNVDQIARLKKETQCQVLVVDHHTLPDEVPVADVILNPKTLPETHPTYFLCTAGIVYYLISALATKDDRIRPFDYLDLAALGTVADVVPLTGYNRILVRDGLAVLSERKRPGIRALLDLAKCDRYPLSPKEIGFVIAPRLNAAGRLGDPKLGARLLLETNEELAFGLAKKLHVYNDERRFIGEQMMKAAVDMVHEIPNYDQQHVLVLSGKDWHSGVIGITASRLCDHFSKPTIIISDESGVGRGSARTIGDIDVYQLLKQCEHYFTTFGGHTKAAGFSIHSDHIPAFQEQLQDISKANIEAKRLKPIIEIDCPIEPTQLNLDFIDEIDALAPFGEGNPQPLFYTNALTAIDFKTVGNGDHLKVTFADKEEKKIIDAIGFGLASKMEYLYKSHVELAFHLDRNTWQGRENPQLMLVDIK